jgi:hypothetical protein
MIDVETFIQEMLVAEQAVRYVCIIDNEYRVLASRQREGVSSLMPDDRVRNFASIVPAIILESVEKLAPFLGEVDGVTAHYEKVLVVFYRFQNLVVFLSLEPEVKTPFYSEITGTFRRLSTRYLAQ